MTEIVLASVQKLSTTRLDSTMSVLSSTRLHSTVTGNEFTISLTSTLPGGNVVSNDKEVSVDTMETEMLSILTCGCHYDLLVSREGVQLHRATVPEVPNSMSHCCRCSIVRKAFSCLILDEIKPNLT